MFECDEEVTYVSLWYHLTFGTPTILQSDRKLDLKLVHGKPCHSQN